MWTLATLAADIIGFAEAEGRLLRRGVVATARAVAWTALAAASAGAALGLVVYGAYLEGAALGRPSFGAFLAAAVAALGALAARVAARR
ncbi:MAG: hypothetical protein ACKOYN_07195, partial [Planctomycetota bacterium]